MDVRGEVLDPEREGVVLLQPLMACAIRWL